MKFFHLSDLHIGRQLHHYSLEQEQRQVLEQIVSLAEGERPDAVVIAGDIYDKAAPSGEAVVLFDWFLTELAQLSPTIPVMMISGNHDSGKRLTYASAMLEQNGIYVAAQPPADSGEYMAHVTLTDNYGPVHFYLLPYLRPQAAKKVLEEEQALSYEETVRRMVEREQLDAQARNVLVSHQFYTAAGQDPIRSDSESIHVGGLDNVDIQALEPFDYVALGHIHRAQQVGKPWIRYSGSPMKYSVSEWNHQKGITEVTLGEKGEPVQIRMLPLKPKRDVVKKRGELKQILQEPGCEDYVSVTLTDEGEIYRPRDFLEQIFPNLLEVRVDNSRTRNQELIQEDLTWEEDPVSLFAEFFQMMQGRGMTEKEQQLFLKAAEKAKEGWQ